MFRYWPALFLFIPALLTAQAIKPKVKDWHYLDYKKDGYMGISLHQAYELLKDKKSEPVIVAVIDSGIDTLQPDLLPVLWRNPKEIPNNGIDEDGNGLVDDYYGWNYLGAPNGENLAVSVSDIYRTYHRFKDQFENKKAGVIPDSLQWQFKEWQRAAKKIEEGYKEASKNIDIVRDNWEAIRHSNDELKWLLKKDVFTNKDLDSIKPNNNNQQTIALWRNIFNNQDFSNAAFVKYYEQVKQETENDLTQKTVPPTPYRDSLLKDNGYDITRTHYGNHNLATHSGYHGTSVSSIIGAVRNNGKGMDGIADNVQIMMIRGILGKDEFDKDVALSIRYAVDHGAKVINMSFGKYISPDKRWTDEAIAYALSKDVILVHGSGNDATDTDKDINYPNAFAVNNTRFPNFLNVGASADPSLGNWVADFSNYGKKTVDIFASGVYIHAAIAGDGTQMADGTSMASPVVAGVAALLRSYFPKLSAAEVVNIIKRSGQPIPEKVNKPGSSTEKVSLSELCETGKVVNAAGAVKLAMELSSSFKK